MAKRKSIIGKLISSLLGTVFLVAIIIVGLCLFVKIKYDVNVINVISQVKTLNESVNETDVFTHKISDSDFASAQTAVNTSISGLIAYSETEGYVLSSSVSGNMQNSMQLTDKQSAALLNMVLNNQETATGLQIGDKTIGFDLIQMKFDNLAENNVDVNVVVKLDISSLKQNMEGFPLSVLSNYIPDSLYISSTITVSKGESAFEYSKTHKEITVNNLNKEETAEFLKTLNLLMQFGEAETLSLSIGGSFVDALLGTSDVAGFAYSLQDAGATGFSFSDLNNAVVLTILV